MDIAEHYRDKEFKGRGFLAVGFVGSQAVPLLMAMFSPQELSPAGITIFLILFIVFSPIYLFGYWQAVQAKSYPPIITVGAFASIVGMIIILYLPDISSQSNPEPDGARNRNRGLQ